MGKGDVQVVLSAVGMPSAVGLTAAQTFTSVRARVSRRCEVGGIYYCYPDDADFEDPSPLVASPLRYLDAVRSRKNTPVEWLSHLASEAYRDLAKSMRLAPDDSAGTGLFIALPPARAGWNESAQDEFLYHFYNTLEIDPFSYVRFDFTGHAGALALCEEASSALREGKIRFAIMGGVDSYLFPEWLEPLDRECRIKSPRSVVGFTPGEAAAFFLLEPARQPEQRGLEPLCVLDRFCRGISKGVDLANRTGIALSDTLRPLLTLCPEPPLVLCDLNGEPGRMKEWGYVLTRLGRSLGNPVALEHPAALLGDCGAATGAGLVVLATFYLQRRYKERCRALLWCAGDGGDRAALLLSAATTVSEKEDKPCRQR